MRSGKAYLATPLGRIPVRRNPNVDIIADLDRSGFLERLRGFARSDNAPGRIRALVHQLENFLFALTEQATPDLVQRVLVLLGAIEHAAGMSPKARDAIPPAPVLSETWAIKANDASTEFRIAAALAGLYAAPKSSGQNKDEAVNSAIGPALLPMRLHVVPIRRDKGHWTWHPESHLAAWGEGDLEFNLINVIERRLLETDRLGLPDKPFAFSVGAHATDIDSFLARETDDTRIAELLAGLALVRLPRELFGAQDEPNAAPLPAAFAVLKPFFTPDRLLHYSHVRKSL